MFGKERVLVVVLGAFAVGNARLRAVALDRACSSPAARSRASRGAIFPLAFGIIRDEFPRERVATGIGLISRDVRDRRRRRASSSAGVIVDNLSYEWLFWLSLVGDRSPAIARHAPVDPGVAGQEPGADRLGRRGAAVGRRCCAC